MGPVGSGKSSLVEKLHRGLEDSESDLCHRRLPNVRRAAPSDTPPSTKGIREDAGRACAREICARFAVFGCKKNSAASTKSFRCARCSFPSGSRIGIGVVPPVDPNNQDTSVLIGSEDISKLDLYSEGDPRVLRT